MKNLPKRVYLALLVSAVPILFSIVSLHFYQKTWALLNRVDSVMECEPRLALQLLDSLDRSRLYDAAQRARFALLYTQAQDKNYIDETNDSLIRVAVDYYEQRSDLRDRFRSLYYLGRVQFNQGQYSRAMVSYMEAEQLKSSIDNDRQLGLLYSQMGGIYKIYYDYPKALDVFEKAHYYYSKAKLPVYKNHALIDIGLVYGRMKQYEKSENCFNIALKDAKNHMDTLMLEYCYGNLIIHYNEQEKFEQATRLYDTLMVLVGEKARITSSFAVSVAYMCANNHKLTKAKYYLDQAGLLAKDRRDSIYLHYYIAKLLQCLSKYSEAYDNLGNSFRLQDSILRQVLQQPILSTQRDFLANKLEYQAYKVQVARKIRYYCISLVVFAFLFVIACLLYQLKKKEAVIRKWMMMHHDLEEAFCRNLNDERRKIKALFESQVSLINRLGKTYYDGSASPNLQKALFKDIMDAINACKSPKKQKELEAIINDYHFNAMHWLRLEFPNFSAQEYRELCFLFAGFGIGLVSVLVDDKGDNVYKRRSRFRTYFEESSAPHRALFVELLGQNS